MIIRQPGPLSTVQDLGRTGYQSLGFPVSGAMDTRALRIGNLLVGNPENAAAIEMTDQCNDSCHKADADHAVADESHQFADDDIKHTCICHDSEVQD